jgi:hypothetical protein
MTRIILLMASLSISISLMAQQDAAVQRSNHYIDHVIVGIHDLDAGTSEIERVTGVRPKFDGSDAQLGTHSAIIGLGDNAFLEIIAPDPDADLSLVDPELKPLIRDRLANYDSLTPFGWAIGTSNLERTRKFASSASSRTTEVMQGSRKRGWGRVTKWQWSRIYRPESHVMPFFVQWSDPGKRPQDRAPSGCALAGLSLFSRTFKSLHTLIATMQVDADPEGADVESINFTLECERGEVVLEGLSLMGPSEPPSARTK